MKKYTLDQIVRDQYVFLERSDEVNQLVIPKEFIHISLKEGDIVTINHTDGVYKIEVLKEETEIAYERAKALLEKLKNKNN